MRKSAWFAGILFIWMLCGCGSALADTSVGDRLSVKSGIANVRAGGGIRHPILWKVEKYYPLVVTAKESGWVQFRDFEGDLGWISLSVVESTSTVIVKTQTCNVRSGPGLDNPVVFTAEKGTPFLVLDRNDTWIHIRHADGDSGWIHRNLVW